MWGLAQVGSSALRLGIVNKQTCRNPVQSLPAWLLRCCMDCAGRTYACSTWVGHVCYGVSFTYFSTHSCLQHQLLTFLHVVFWMDALLRLLRLNACHTTTTHPGLHRHPNCAQNISRLYPNGSCLDSPAVLCYSIQLLWHLLHYQLLNATRAGQVMLPWVLFLVLFGLFSTGLALSMECMRSMNPILDCSTVTNHLYKLSQST